MWSPLGCIVAILTDAQQNPIVGAAVTFTVKKGGGHLPEGTDSLAVTTDESGLAAVPLTLGTEEGWDRNVVAASFDGMATFPATFRASAFLPGDPQATRITGVILDNQGDPVPGVTMRLRGSTLSVLTNELGAFELSGVPVGQVFLIADASTTSRPGSWANLEFEMLTIAGINNSLPKPIYILPLDLPHGLTVYETHGGTLTIPGIPGFSLEVTPGSVTFPTGSRSGVVSVTAVHADRIPMAPGAGMQPRLIVTIQPAGARFDPPAAITFPNVDGRPPGTVTELFSFDHSIGAFVSIGTGTVSEDGRVLRSDPGFGVVEAGWHCGSPVTLSGLFTILHVKIKNHDPVILLVDQPPANQRLIEADGEPSEGVDYDWEGSDPAKVTLTPKGPHLCPDASVCQTLARAVSIGETRATVTLICQFTRATSSASVRVVAAKIRLKEVSFSGTTYRAVAEDGKTTTYDAPHWQDNSSPPDGDADDPGDHRFPVSFTRGGKIKVSAVFTIEPDVTPADPVKVRGKVTEGLLGLTVPETVASVSEGKITMGEVELEGGTLPNTIAFINPLRIAWEVTVDGGKTWAPAGESDNRIYVRFAEPITSKPLYESVLEISCRNAKGVSDVNSAVSAIWSDFEGPFPGVRRKQIDGHNKTDDAEMHYWIRVEDPNASGVPTACDRLSFMLDPDNDRGPLKGVGTCHAWVELFAETLRVQGIPGVKIYEVTSSHPTIRYSAPNNNFQIGPMLVREWSFSDPGGAPASCGGSAAYLFPSQVKDGLGVPGQGDENPPGIFHNHFVAVFNGSIYDPSYGTGPFGGDSLATAVRDWENASIAGYSILCMDNTDPKHPELIEVSAKNNPSVQEVIFNPVNHESD